MLSCLPCFGSGVAAMEKPPKSVLGRNAGQRLDNRLLQSVSCPSLNAPQDGFQLREGFLDWREIRRIRRQEEELASSGFDRLVDARSSMSREIVQDHDLA